MAEIDKKNFEINSEDNYNVDTSNKIFYGTKANDTFYYAEGDDVIFDYSGEDTIKITQGKVDSYSFDGGDLIFHIGEGSLRLKNTANHAVTVQDSTGTSTKIYSNGYSPQKAIKNFVQALNKSALSGTAALD